MVHVVLPLHSRQKKGGKMVSTIQTYETNNVGPTTLTVDEISENHLPRCSVIITDKKLWIKLTNSLNQFITGRLQYLRSQPEPADLPATKSTTGSHLLLRSKTHPPWLSFAAYYTFTTRQPPVTVSPSSLLIVFSIGDPTS